MAVSPSFVLIISVFLLFVFPPSLSLPLSSINRCPSHESQALLRFKAHAFNDSFGYLTSWVNGTDCCTDWTGISCDNLTNHVVSVEILPTSRFRGGISESLCQLTFLRSLYIFGGESGTAINIPPCLGNLSFMQYLFLYGNSLAGMIPPSLCLLNRLTFLSLSDNHLNGSIPSCLGNLSSMQSLILSGNHISGMIPTSLCLLNRLTELDLSDNHLNGSIPACLGNLSYTQSITLSGNGLSGMIPTSLCLLTHLTFLDLSHNKLKGIIPSCLGNLTILTSLYLNENQLSGDIPNSLGNLSLLTELSINNNQLSGTVPSSFSRLSSLTRLDASDNHFNETVSSSLPPSLRTLTLSLNHHYMISETFFDKLRSLDVLYLSDCVLNISATWIPSFQLSRLYIVSCMIGTEFPLWISTQFALQQLELSNTSLVGAIPSWLWETSPQLYYLSLSMNRLQGRLFPNTSILPNLVQLDVSRNRLTGHIPSMWSSSVQMLLLNDNSFTGNIPPSLGNISDLQWLNLANNKITGEIPKSLSNCSSLAVLNLGNNSLEGSLPHEFSKLSDLYSLVAHSNYLIGSFPPSIVKCSNLQVLDIGNNFLGGEIPASLTNLSNLRVLVMNKNNFTGKIPSQIGQLMNLQILLLSSNQISGPIPHTIVSLQAMAIESQDGFVLSNFYYGNIYQDGLDMTSKSRLEHYTYILSTLTSIDLSDNELEGQVPSEFGNLKGLRFLNLSMNNFNGNIPISLGEIRQLESLDLSRNCFSGQVPIGLEALSFLGALNLSNNKLSGRIPQGQHILTFGESSFSGNPNLWGCPLPKNCSWPRMLAPPPISMSKGKKSPKFPWYAVALGLSYGVAFGGIVSLILIKMSWRRNYFNTVDTILKFLFPWMKNLTL